MTIAIKIENLSKQYELRHQKRERYTTLRDVIANKTASVIEGLRNFGHSNNHFGDSTREAFWALKSVNLEIQQGDRVGIIGRNGAGKSTLLKLLSRIIEPTSGKISIKGRMSSLLEVGTGFHPELTGRENVYLNGAILGMRHHEIKSKFDEIVAFADVERFLDTPVKHYSSGMYMRLAFSVAAHLDPEILVVDEVLAVGDAEFQKKCLGKMKEVGNEGRTVLFVSHNVGAIEQICNKGVLMHNGEVIVSSDDVSSVIHRYLAHNNDVNNSSEWSNVNGLYENECFIPDMVRICDKEGLTIKNIEKFSKNNNAYLIIQGSIFNPDNALQVGYALYHEDGSLIYSTCHNDVKEELWPILKKGQAKFKTLIPLHLLHEGRYSIEVIVTLYRREWICEPRVNSPIVHFTVQGNSESPYFIAKRPGILAPILSWDVE